MIPLGVLASARVAAGGAWSPASLSGLVAWYDASDAATITQSAGAVSAWADKSGNGYNLAQDSAPARPTTGAATQNSLNVLVFDGNDDLRASTAAIANGSSTFYLVARFTTDNRWLATNGGAWQWFGFGSWYAGASGPSISPAASTDTWYALGVQFAGASSWMRRNGSQVAAGNPGANTTIQNLSVGSRFAGWYVTGQLGEVIVVGGSLTTGERSSLESYLMTKWGIA